MKKNKRMCGVGRIRRPLPPPPSTYACTDAHIHTHSQTHTLPRHRQHPRTTLLIAFSGAYSLLSVFFPSAYIPFNLLPSSGRHTDSNSCTPMSRLSQTKREDRSSPTFPSPPLSLSPSFCLAVCTQAEPKAHLRNRIIQDSARCNATGGVDRGGEAVDEKGTSGWGGGWKEVEWNQCIRVAPAAYPGRVGVRGRTLRLTECGVVVIGER